MKKILALLSLVASMGLAASAQTANYPESQLNPSYAADTGAADVLVVVVPNCPSSYTVGALFKVKPNHANATTTPTLNVCGLGAKTITKLGTAALAANDLITTAIAMVVYDGTGMELFDPQTNGTGTISGVSGTAPIGGGGTSGAVVMTCTTCTTNASPLTSGNVMLGGGANASQVDSSMAVAGHLFTNYAGLATAGLGVPVVLAVSDVTAQTASQTTVNLIASTSAAGAYTVHLYMDQNALCTTGTGSVFATINWTDATHAHSATTVPLNLIITAVSTPFGYVSADVPLWAASASAITYTTTYSACATGTASYDLHATVFRTN